MNWNVFSGKKLLHGLQLREYWIYLGIWIKEVYVKALSAIFLLLVISSGMS